MIEFLTVFIGFFTGLHTVELDVGKRVASVEVLLDGHQIGTMEGEPWSIACDFGFALEPHELEAIAYDSQNRPLQRIRQAVNYTPGTPPFEASSRELTSVVINLDHGTELPPSPEMDGWFVGNDSSLKVAEVSAAPSEILIVIEPTAHATLNRLADSLLDVIIARIKVTTEKGLNVELDSVTRSRWVTVDPEQLPDQQAMIVGAAQDHLRKIAPLDPTTGVRFLSPLAAPPSRVPRAGEVFRARRMSTEDGGFLYLSERASTSPLSLRIADSLAVAASKLYRTGRPRAVVVVLGDDDREDSFYSPAQVRGYLDCLQVPLHVWSVVPQQNRKGWGAVRLIGPPRGGAAPEVWKDSLLDAAETLKAGLDRQRVIWLAGRHLPQHVDLGVQTEGIELLGSRTGGAR